MRRIWLAALSGALATATMAFAVDDASAYRRAAGVRAVAHGGIATQGVYRRAYRRAAYGVGVAGVATYGVAARRGTAAGLGSGYGAYAAATPGNVGTDSYAARIARGLVQAPEAMTAWVNYPTRGEYIRGYGYVPPSY